MYFPPNILHLLIFKTDNSRTPKYIPIFRMSDQTIREIDLECQREEILAQYRRKCRLLELERRGAKVVYANQATAAMKIVEHFRSGKVWVVLVAPPGAGKTGVILEVLRQFGQHNGADQIHVDDMLLITGMSDTDWASTMKDGTLPILHKTVHHRAMLGRKEGMRDMRNGIIVTDECHVACLEDQTIDKKLEAAGLKSIPALEERNMRMLDVSATPEGVLADLKRWREKTAVVVLETDEKYKGFQSMKDEGRLRSSQAYDLENLDKAKELLQLLDDRYRGSTKKYFAFRVTSLTARGNIATACSSLGWDVPQNHDSQDRILDVDTMMEAAPAKHKVLFVKGFWRASKRLVRKHVGGTYESPTVRADDTSKSQGLTARFCSTFEWEGDQMDVALRPLHFDELESIDRYLTWWDAGCDYATVAYQAPRLRSDGEGSVRHPKTKAHPNGVEGAEAIEEDLADVPAPMPTPPRRRAAPVGTRINRSAYIRKHKEFLTAEAAKAYYVRRFGEDAGFASKPHRCPTTGKFQCSFSNVNASVCDITLVRSRLSSGNLWGANIEKLDDNTHRQIGTLKVGYSGDTPTFVLCVFSKTDFLLED